MRDYSFGNFISTLRERKGLSQYQLGVLVGVSDKAVSKWENGASKPRTNIIRKLSEVLDVSVDELLTCEYVTLNTKRKDLFAMKKEIIKQAEQRLRELYGELVPISIMNRFNMEKLMLENNDAVLWMGFLGKLQELFSKEDIYFELRSPQTEASFMAWLLGCTIVNPLPAHYYCPKCKKVEFVQGELCGLDLPDKKCSCGSQFSKDGFTIDVMNMYPISNRHELHVPNKGIELAKKYLNEYFEGYGSIREIVIGDENGDADSSDYSVSRYVLVSAEQAKAYPNEKTIVDGETCMNIMREMPGVTLVEYRGKQAGSIYGKDLNISRKQIEDFYECAAKSGYFQSPYRDICLDSAIKYISKPKFTDIIALCGCLHGTSVWEDNAEVLLEEGIPLDRIISCREDVYHYLYKMMNGKCCDNPSGQVYEIKEAVRKGRYSNGRMPAAVENLLLECDVPKWYVESMKKIKYLFPKTHLITIVKRDIVNYIENTAQ